jgi:hypothetical protein
VSLAGGRAGSLALQADVAAPQPSASFLPQTWQSQLAHTLQEDRESRRVPSNGRRRPTRQTLRLLLLHRRRRSRTCRRKSTPPRSVSTSCRTIHSAQAAQLPFRSVPHPCPRFPDADRAEENSRIPRCALFLLQVQPTRWVDCIHVILSLCSPSLNLSRPPMRRQATSTNGGRPRHYHSLWVAREGLPHCGPVKTTLVGIPSYAADPVSSCVAALDPSSDSSNIARFHVIAQPATIRIAERMATSSPPMKTTDSSCIPSYRSMSALGTRVCRYRRTSRVLGVSPIPALSPVPSLLASSSC